MHGHMLCMARHVFLSLLTFGRSWLECLLLWRAMHAAAPPSPSWLASTADALQSAVVVARAAAAAGTYALPKDIPDTAVPERKAQLWGTFPRLGSLGPRPCHPPSPPFRTSHCLLPSAAAPSCRASHANTTRQLSGRLQAACSHRHLPFHAIHLINSPDHCRPRGRRMLLPHVRSGHSGVPAEGEGAVLHPARPGEATSGGNGRQMKAAASWRVGGHAAPGHWHWRSQASY